MRDWFKSLFASEHCYQFNVLSMRTFTSSPRKCRKCIHQTLHLCTWFRLNIGKCTPNGESNMLFNGLNTNSLFMMVESYSHISGDKKEL